MHTRAKSSLGVKHRFQQRTTHPDRMHKRNRKQTKINTSIDNKPIHSLGAKHTLQQRIRHSGIHTAANENKHFAVAYCDAHLLLDIYAND